MHHVYRRCMLLLSLPSAAATPIRLSDFVPLRFAGLGRCAAAPALFLSETREGPVLPVPIPADAVMACEQALNAARPSMVEVLLQAQATAGRDGGLFDNLPFAAWNPAPQAKRDAFARCSGRGYPREGYRSAYHLLVDMARRDACADIACVVLENTALLGDSLVVGGALVLERRLPMARDSGSFAAGAGPPPAQDARWRAKDEAEGLGDGRGGDEGWQGEASLPELAEDATLCECTADEALGVALALGCRVLVDARVWESGRTAPRYSQQRGKMRLEVMPRTAERAEGEEGGEGERRPPPPLPWEISSADELLSLSLEDKARSALRAGLRLPRRREATNEVGKRQSRSTRGAFPEPCLPPSCRP